MDPETYEFIANEYGHYASWAVWALEGPTPKSNVGDLTVFDIDINPTLLGILKPNIVMVGLNISRPIEDTFGNFHDKKSISQDYKIRYALKDSCFYGAYMTDIIKDFENATAGNVMKHLRENPNFEQQNVDIFLQELEGIGAEDPLIIAFGNDAFHILDRNFGDRFRIHKVRHYSMQMNKDDYRNEIMDLCVVIE